MAQETISENTRKIRRSLMTASLIGGVVSFAGVSIRKVTVFGTEFNIENFEAIPIVLGVIILYLWITFITYAFAEYQEKYKSAQSVEISILLSGKYPSINEIENKAAILIGKEIPQLELSLEDIGKHRKDLEKNFDNSQYTINKLKTALSDLEIKKEDLKRRLTLPTITAGEDRTLTERINEKNYKISEITADISAESEKYAKIKEEIRAIDNYRIDKANELKNSKQELEKLETVLHRYGGKSKRTLGEWRHLPTFRSIIELGLPIFVGFVAMIIVFFFTEFKVEQTDTAKPKVTIQTDKVIIQQSPNKK